MSEFEKPPGLKKIIPWWLPAIFLLLTGIIILMGSYYYKSERKRIFEEQEKSLSAIASLKIKQISQWYSDKLADAVLIKDNEPLTDRIKEFLKDENQTRLRKEITIWLEALNTQYDYNSVAILDTLLRVRIATSNADPLADDSIRKELNNVIRYHKIIMTDLHRTGTSHAIRMDLLVPLLDPSSKEQKTIGLVILCIDPDKILFPLVQSWPTPSRSSETLILRREGDSVVYLNELRHRKSTALNLKFPLSKVNLLATKVVNGLEGVTEGIDYRNIPVIGALSKIPGLPWYMVAKTDKSEILEPFQRYSIITVVVIILLIVLNFLIFGYWVWAQYLKMYRLQLNDEISLRKSEELLNKQYYTLKGIVESSRGPIFSLDKTYCYTSFNKVHSNVMKFLYGVDIEIGKNMLDYQTNDDDRIKAKTNLDRALSGEYVEESAWSGEDVNNRRFFEVTHNPIFNAVNEVIGVAVNARDLTERKLVDEKLRETNEYLSNLFNYANAPIITWDTSLLITRFNHAFEELSGYSEEEVIGKKIDILFTKEKTESSLSLIKDAVSGERWETVEIEILRKDGDSRMVLWNSANIHDKDGKTVIATIAQGYDITERKRIEYSLLNSEERFRSLYENATIGIYRTTLDGKILLANPALVKMLGFSSFEDLAHRNLGEEGYEPDYPRAKFLDILEKEGKIIGLESAWHQRNGKTLYVRESASIIRDAEGNVLYFDGNVEDITYRKQVDEALRESEKRLREAQEMAHLGFWLWNIKTGNVDWSDEVFKIFRLDPATFKPQIDSILKLSPWPEENQRDKELISRAIESHEPGTYEQKFLHPDKSIGYYYSTFRGNYDNNGDLISIVGTILDITERKKAEEILQESEAKFRKLIESAPLPLCYVDKDGMITLRNERFIKIFGYNETDVPGLREWWLKAYPDPEYRKWVVENWNEAVVRASKNGTDIQSEEYKVNCKDGSVRTIIISGITIGENLLATFIDITDRKIAEEALRESEDKFKYIFDHSAIGKSVTKPTGEISVNKAFCEMTGYSSEELMNTKWQDISHPDDIEMTQNVMNSLLSGEKDSARFVKRYIHKNGRIVWTDVGSALRRDEKGNPLYFLTAIIDITERKRAEESLRLKNFVFDDSIAANSISDINGILTEVNAAFLRIWGYQSRDEVIGKSIAIFIKSDADAKKVLIALTKYGEWEGDYSGLRKDGSTFIAHGLATLVKDEKGKGIGYQSAVLDVTDAKNTEEKIKKQMVELKRFNRSMVDREIRMIQLKQEINTFCNKLNLPEKYSIPKIKD